MTNKPSKSTNRPAKGARPTKAAGNKKASIAEQPRPMVEDMVATRLLRDVNLKEKVYLDRKIMLALSACLIVSLLGNFTLATRKPDIQYFATDDRGQLMKMTSLDQPIHSVNEVLSWATSSITRSYTFSFANYRQQLQESRDFFTTAGWTGFQEALDASGNLRTVIANKMVTTAVPRGAPVVVGEGYLNGRFAWKIEVPILVTYQSANARTTQDLLVQAVIVRRSELEHPMGLGIAQIIGQ